MTTVVRDGDGITVFAKGSPEKMLDLCAVDAKTRGEIEREIAKFQAQSCRVLGFAHRHISDKAPTLRLSITLPTAPAWNPA